MISLSIAAPIAAALVGAIGVLWNELLKAQKKVSGCEEKKLEMVLKEANDAKELMIGFLKDEQYRNEMKESIQNLTRMVESLK